MTAYARAQSSHVMSRRGPGATSTRPARPSRAAVSPLKPAVGQMELEDVYNINGSFPCLNFSQKTANIVHDAKMSLSSCAIFANLVAIGFVFFAKRYKDFIYRLMAYLMATNVFQALATIFVSLPVRVPHDYVVQVNQDGCIASGFFSMSTMWMGNIMFFWITLYLAYRGWCLYRHVDSRKDADMTEGVEDSVSRSKVRSRVKEIVGAVIVFVAPFAIASIPFALEHSGYGLSGLWCWIKAFKYHCGDAENYILILLIVMFYGPLVIVVLLAVVFILIGFCCYFHGEVRKNDKNNNKKERYIKEIMILLPLPLVYLPACMFLLINRIYTTTTDMGIPHQELWIVHAIADSTRVLLPALAFLLHPFVWKDKTMCLCLPKSKPHTGTDADSPQEALITAPPGYRSRGYYGSCNMSDTNSVFDNSTKSYDWD